MNRTGALLKYNVGGISLSFGQIVTFGDLYGNCKPLQQCPTQISDSGQSESQRVQIFRDIAGQIPNSQNDTSTLQKILNILTIQKTDTQSSQDPGQKFASGNSGIGGWDVQFAIATQGTYVAIALCNWDHFGQDAVTAYTTGHTYALSLAAKANDPYDLLDAYFYEAFAQHYLSDLFSTGHLRAPRRALHGDPSTVAPPADVCNKYMHDEDSASGLWVTNTYGSSWPAYGDKQLFASKSFVNLDRAVDAMQAGANELYQAYLTKKTIQPEDYKPLKMIPTIPVGQGGNFVPMFSTEGNSPTETLFQRTNLNSRSDARMTSYNLSEVPWSKLKSFIESSDIITNMYPRTIQDFTPEANITQLRQLNATHFLINTYGPTWTRLYSQWPGQTAQRSWNMRSQSISAIGPGISEISWEWADQVDKAVFSLFGTSGADLILLGISNDPAQGASGAWNVTVKNTAPCPTPIYVYGNMSMDSRPGLIRSCGGSKPRFELWTQPSSTSAPILAMPWNASNPDNRITLQSHSTFVDATYFAANQSYVWNLNTWTDQYKQRMASSVVESRVANAAQRILADKSTSDVGFARLTYGNNIQIEYLLINNSAVNVLSKQIFSAFNPSTCTSLSWFLMPLLPNAYSSVIGYCISAPLSTVSTVVFEPLSTPRSGYQQPRITTFTPDFLPKFSGPFTMDILTTTTQIFSPNTQLPGKVSAGLLHLFDNYGILGARLLNPVKGDESAYAVVGQVPAIAGQLSQALKGNGNAGLGFIFD
ncbi:hypothetical protein MMC27_008792 [Xylographa pallens]|nr:hypothetical protein [Xylographa pallens]